MVYGGGESKSRTMVVGNLNIQYDGGGESKHPGRRDGGGKSKLNCGGVHFNGISAHINIISW